MFPGRRRIKRRYFFGCRTYAKYSEYGTLFGFFGIRISLHINSLADILSEKEVMRVNFGKINTPDGTRDSLFSECTDRRRIRGALMSLFASRSYCEVMTPGFEFYDLFVRAEDPIPQESMFKLVDRSGRLLVMRPDCTAPIARVVATHLKDAVYPVRLCYDQAVFRSEAEHRGATCEIAQCGIELIGADGLRGDIEAVAMAADALAAAEAPDFYIELGHVDYFGGLADELNLGRERTEELRHCIESKNFALLDGLLKDYSGPAARALRRLPYLFGGEETLDEAEALAVGERAHFAVKRLRDIYNEISPGKRGGRLRFDLGLVQHLGYYSGLVFRGYCTGAGSAVLAGGRYDGLLSDFGCELLSIGFAVYADTLAACLPSRALPGTDTLIYYDDGCLDSAVELLSTLPPGTAELSTFTELGPTLALARRKAADRVLHVSKGGISEVYVNE